MINYKEIMQGSGDWFELKWGKIGGTLSKGLFVNSDTLFIDILSQRLEKYELELGYESEAMERGKELEPEAILWLQQYTGFTFEKSGWLQCEKNELLGISPDGLTEDETVGCEVKCPSRKKHTETLINNDIPKDNYPQCVHYFTVNPKLEKLYFISFRPESVKPFVKLLTRDSLVDLGLTKKIKETRPNAKGKDFDYIVTVPDVKTIWGWVSISRTNADELLVDLKLAEEKLKF